MVIPRRIRITMPTTKPSLTLPSTSSPVSGRHAVRVGVQGHGAGGGAAGLVPAGGQEGVLRRLPLHLLRPAAARRGAGDRLAPQHHGLLHALLHPGHEGVPQQGGSTGAPAAPAQRPSCPRPKLFSSGLCSFLVLFLLLKTVLHFYFLLSIVFFLCVEVILLQLCVRATARVRASQGRVQHSSSIVYLLILPPHAESVSSCSRVQGNPLKSSQWEREEASRGEKEIISFLGWPGEQMCDLKAV